MEDWVRELFIGRADLFLKVLDFRWDHTQNLVDGMSHVLKEGGIVSGQLLDLFCGNGRVSIHMAKRGFTVVGVDISKTFIEDARKKAVEHEVSNAATFIAADARNLRQVISADAPPFDVVVNTWTSVGYYSPKEDQAIFTQARELSRQGAMLIVAQTLHSEYLSLRFAPAIHMEVGNMIVLESREYDPIKSRMSTLWRFYEKRGDDLKYLDAARFELHIYSLGEFCALLSDAGWETVATYGSLKTLQPLSPLSKLNIIAKAK